MTAPRVLLVEDETPIRTGLRDHLLREGFAVVEADCLASARRELRASVDLVILDRRLPDGDGLALLDDLRGREPRVPVIVLSALGQVEDRVRGLEGGADDYVSKPFALRELVARAHAVLARAAPPRVVEFGVHRLDMAARTLSCQRRDVALSRLEFELLAFLAANPHRAIGRNELLDRVWGYDRYPTTRTVDFHVLSLRKKLALRADGSPHLVTVHRVGYRFEP